MPTRWVAFTYRGFWDVPRVLLLELRGAHLVLESEFDEVLDDYSDDYVVYEVPSSFQWQQVADPIAAHSLRRLGTIRVSDVKFDESKRRSIAEESLTPVIAWLERNRGEP
ncbi:MAG: hypothetical protein QM817_38545 [Archangium sp.]